MSIAFDIARDGLLIAAGAALALGFEHGFGWLRTWAKARAQRVQSQAESAYAEIGSAVDAAFKSKSAELDAAVADARALVARVGKVENDLAALTFTLKAKSIV